MASNLSYHLMQQLREVVSSFQVHEGTIDNIEPFGEGRINRTYKVTIRSGEKQFVYLLQNVNHSVFKDTKALMDNVITVTEYIRHKGGRTLEFIPCKEESSVALTGLQPTRKYICIDHNLEHAHWRMYYYIDADVYPCIVHPHQAYLLGEAIAGFSKALDGFETIRLKETIPNFHNTPKRCEDFLFSVAKDAIQHKGRIQGIEKEIDYIIERRSSLGQIMDALQKGEIPYRVTHNDPKLNNVLFDKATSQPICMIDLDTVMPGTCLFDVGDALRSIANTASEDDKTTENVSFSVEIYEEFVKGFLQEMKAKLTPKEKELIPTSVWTIAMELGMRFLKDHIDGNVYFKTDYDGQNLERARVQLCLAKKVAEKMLSGELYAVLK